MGKVIMGIGLPRTGDPALGGEGGDLGVVLVGLLGKFAKVVIETKNEIGFVGLRQMAP